MTGTSGSCALDDHAGGGRAVDRVEHEHRRPSVMAVVDLLLLGVVLIGVEVVDLAVGAQLLDLRLEERLVEGLVAGGLGLGEQQGDGLAAATVAGVAVARLFAPQAAKAPSDDDSCGRGRRRGGILFTIPPGRSGRRPRASKF